MTDTAETKTIKMKTLSCTPEHQLQKNGVYTLDAKEAEYLVKTGHAEFCDPPDPPKTTEAPGDTNDDTPTETKLDESAEGTKEPTKAKPKKAATKKTAAKDTE